MFCNTHATVGQSQGSKVLSAPQRAGSSATPGLSGPSLSPVPRPLSPRLGLSLTEVLISMGILTVGLLGVASVFPVASFYMQKGDVADRGSAIAQAAFNEAISRGWLNPENWLAWEDTVSGITLPPGNVNRTFSRQFAETFRRKKSSQLYLAGTPVQNEQEITREFGSVFMIDPLGVASVSEYNATSGQNTANTANWLCGKFPTTSPTLNPLPMAAWTPWFDTGGLSTTRWPVRRLTLREIPTGAGASVMANRLFSTSDDLVFDVPASQDKPSVQRFELANLDNGPSANDALTRQSRGDYSWFITVCPTTPTARDALATDPGANSYEIAVVVFYKRPLGVETPSVAEDTTANRDLLAANERAVHAKIVSSGLNGGEVLLEKYGNDSMEESPFVNLKVGNWVYLCGPHPSSTDVRPMMTARWYQVLAIEGKTERLNSIGTTSPVAAAGDPERRLVALRGPEWPWQPATNAAGIAQLDNYSHLSNSLYVCIPSGAVAVHAKTIRLEGDSTWSGGAGGFGVAAPVGTLPPGGKAF